MWYDRTDADFWFFRGEIARMQGHSTKALFYYERALEAYPDHEDALFAHGREFYIYMQTWVVSSFARADTTPGFKLIEKNPKRAFARYKRGVWDETLSKYDKAIWHYTTAVGIEPRYASAFHRRGVVHRTLGEYDAAIADYTKAIEIQPKYAVFYVRRGNAHHWKGDYDKAISDFTRAIEVDPKDAWAYYRRGRAFSAKGQYDLAVSDYSKAVEIYPGYTAFHLKSDHAELWEDVRKAQDMGCKVEPRFIEALRLASRRKA